jgi:hypothetical protein
VLQPAAANARADTVVDSSLAVDVSFGRKLLIIFDSLFLGPWSPSSFTIPDLDHEEWGARSSELSG